MSEPDRGAGEDFVVAPRPEQPDHDADRSSGELSAGDPAREARRIRHVANPDDPAVPAPLGSRRARVPAPDSYFLGRMAIVQGQVYIVGVILVVQLWLITAALFELLSGRPQSLWGLTIASGIGCIIAVVVALWPRRRARGE